MAKEFTYFAGTLPTQFFGEKSPMSIAEFDEDSARLLDAETAALLKKVTLYTEDTAGFPETVKKFYDWENALRNTLLDLRKKVRSDAGDFKRNNPDFYSEIASGAAQAFNNPDLLEAEKILDRMRWNAMDNISVGHYTDFTVLAFYRIKLAINSKYQLRTAENGNAALENILRGMMEEKAIN
ncbi:MAG: hypothetical protein J6Q81_04725 [Lentisphaeria bacterium]|nr:hypothetical protein [Lentisphaeria bacterium]